MTLFESVKQAVTTRQAAERYGLEVKRSGMVICPFHEDHNPSLLLDQRFYCFGCHAAGDVIDFTARLFGLSLYHAAQKLAADFGINPRPPTQRSTPTQKPVPIQRPQKISSLPVAEELQRLRYWKQAYAPKAPEDPLDVRFVQSCREISNVEYLLECMIDDPERTFPLWKQYNERRNAA